MYDVITIVNWLRVRNNSSLRTDENVEELTKFKAMKLLYYIQGASLIYLKQRLFPQDIIAYKNGPIIEKVNKEYPNKRVIIGTITNNDINDYKKLNANKKCAAILNTVYDTFGNISTHDLTSMIQTESPWENTQLGNKITNREMIKYFKNIVKS